MAIIDKGSMPKKVLWHLGICSSVKRQKNKSSKLLLTQPYQAVGKIIHFILAGASEALNLKGSKDVGERRGSYAPSDTSTDLPTVAGIMLTFYSNVNNTLLVTLCLYNGSIGT